MNLTFVYVAVIYFGAVWLCNRSSQKLPWRFALLFYAIVLASLFRPLTMGWVDLPLDYIYRLYPWRGAFAPVQNGNPELNDLALQIVPWAHLVRDSWKHFEAPLWNASAGAGYPLLANAQSAALSPLRLLALPLSLGHSFAFEAAMKLLIALTGGFLFMRRRRFSKTASVMTAVSFAFSTFMTAWLHFPLATTVCWLPALFLAVDLLYDCACYPRFLFLTAVFSVVIFGGSPETTAFTVLTAALYALWMFVIAERKRDAVRGLGLMTAAGLTSVLLAAPFLFPFFESLEYSQRYAQLDRSGPRLTMLEPRALVTFVNPDFFGSTHDGNIWGPGIAELISGYAGVFAIVAIIAVALSLLVDRKWRRFELGLLVVVILFFGIVMGWPFFSDLYASTPFLWRAAHGRLRAPLCWILAIFAGCAVDLLRQQKYRGIAIASSLAGLALLALPFFTIAFPNAVTRNAVLSASLIRIVVALLAIATAFAVRRKALLASLLVLATTTDLAVFALRWNGDVREELAYPKTRLLETLDRGFSKRVEGDVSLYRIAATGGTMFPNLAAMYGYQDIRAHDPMANVQALGTLKIFAGYTSDDYFAMLRNTDHPVMDFLNVRYIIAAPQEILPWGHYSPVYSGPDGRIYQNNRVVPRFFAVKNVIGQFNDADRDKAIRNNPDWATSAVIQRLPTWLYEKVRGDLFARLDENAPRTKVTIVDATPRQFLLHVDAPRWTLVASSQPYWPGWRIWDAADKEVKVITVNGAFIGFLAPPGQSDLRMVYNPRSFYMGMYLSLVTLGLIALGYILSRRHTRTLQSASASL